MTAIAIAVTAAACGAAEADPTGASIETPGTPTTSVVALTGDADAAASTTAVERIDEAAISTIPAERVDNQVVITWIGGSHVEFDDRSLPAAVRTRLPRIGTRPLELVADVRTAPLPADIEERVVRAADQGVDGLIVPLNVSWVRWDGNARCDDITPAYAFYACILAPPTDEVAAELLADVESLVDAVIATALPAYVYIIPHSEESLADPTVAALVTGAERDLASLDPGLDRIAFGTQIANRGLPDMREGVEFFDMVHPTVAGADALAAWFAPEFERFFGNALG